MWCGRVVYDALRCGVGAVVEEDATAGEAMDRPVVDAAFVVGVRTENVRTFGPIVEGLRWNVCEMPETVPLSSALSLDRVSGIGFGQIPHRALR